MPVSADGTGTLVLNPKFNNDVITANTRTNTPLTDFGGYLLTLDGPDTEEMTFPANGKVEGLTPGDYTVGLTNMTVDFVPAFNAPRYGGTKTATVAVGAETSVAIVLTQVNAGVKFVYDQSLVAAGLSNLVPTLTQGINALTYDGVNHDAIGYFASGTVEMTLDNNGKVVTIGGNGNKEYTLAAKELWTITFKVAEATGGLSVSAEIDVTVMDKTDEVEVDIDSGNVEEGLITFNGLHWMDRNLGAITADFENDWDNAIGHFYQWGRNTAFSSTQTIKSISGPVTAEEANATENLDKFIKKMSGDWLVGTDNARWQTVASQPCPEGYRIPTASDFLGIFTPSAVLINMYNGPRVETNEVLSTGPATAHYWGDNSNKIIYGIKRQGTDDAYYMKWEWLKTEDNLHYYAKISRWDADATATFTGKTLSDATNEFVALGDALETITFPAAGYIGGSNAAYSAGSPGGYYWSSTLFDSAGARRVEFTNGKMIATDDTYKSRVAGHSIRCIKE